MPSRRYSRPFTRRFRTPRSRTIPPRRRPTWCPSVATGALGPSRNGFSTRSSSTDPDFWKFQVDGFSTVTVAVDWYQSLSTLFVAVEADDPEARGIEEMTTSGGPATGRLVLTGLLPPGGYRVRVGGTGSPATGYSSLVGRHRCPATCSKTTTASLRRRVCSSNRRKWTAFGLRTWGPGTYDATLHQEPGVPVITGGVGGLLMDDDYFRLEVPDSGANVLRRAGRFHSSCGQAGGRHALRRRAGGHPDVDRRAQCDRSTRRRTAPVISRSRRDANPLSDLHAHEGRSDGRCQVRTRRSST